MKRTIKKVMKNKKTVKKGGTQSFFQSLSDFREYSAPSCTTAPLFVELVALLLKCDISKLNLYLQKFVPYIIHNGDGSPSIESLSAQGVSQVSLSELRIVSTPLPNIKFSNYGVCIHSDLQFSIDLTVKQFGAEVKKVVDVNCRVRVDITFLAIGDGFTTKEIKSYTPMIHVEFPVLDLVIRDMSSPLNKPAAKLFNLLGNADKLIIESVDTEIRKIPEKVVHEMLGFVDSIEKGKVPFMKKDFFETILFPNFRFPA